MSLESKLEALTVVVGRLVAAIESAKPPALSVLPRTVSSVPVPPPHLATSITAAAQGDIETAIKAAPAPDTAGHAITYDDVKAAVITLASKKGRDVAVAALKDLGVDNAQQLKADQYGAAVVALAKALG